MGSIILINEKFFTERNPSSLVFQKWVETAQIPAGTPIEYAADLPETDDEGKPIYAFSVAGNEVHYWRGEPIAQQTVESDK